VCDEPSACDYAQIDGGDRLSGFGRRVVFGEALVRATKLAAPLGILPLQVDAAPTNDPLRDSTIDIKRLGAVGDGQTDDTASFRSALSGNAAVFVPPGIYRLTAPLKLDSSVVFGSGPHSVLKCANPGFNLFEVSGTGSRLHGLAIIGAAIDETTNQTGIVTSTVSPPDDFSVFDVRFSDLNNGMKFEDQARNCRVQNNHFERLVGKTSGHGYGILTGEVDGLVVTGNTFLGSRSAGHVVLDLAAIADNDIGADHYVLPDYAISTDDRVLENVGEMPDLCAVSDSTVVVDNSKRMHEIRRLSCCAHADAPSLFRQFVHQRPEFQIASPPDAELICRTAPHHAFFEGSRVAWTRPRRSKLHRAPEILTEDSIAVRQ
jgi:hypothetical protein